MAVPLAYLLEERHDRVLVHGEMKVTRHQDQSKISPSLCRKTRFRNNISCTLSSAPKRYREIGTAGVDCYFAGETEEA